MLIFRVQKPGKQGSTSFSSKKRCLSSSRKKNFFKESLGKLQKLWLKDSRCVTLRIIQQDQYCKENFKKADDGELKFEGKTKKPKENFIPGKTKIKTTHRIKQILLEASLKCNELNELLQKHGKKFIINIFTKKKISKIIQCLKS